jgi:pimeloyl-ACP methyl ester carboxylesterase
MFETQTKRQFLLIPIVFVAMFASCRSTKPGNLTFEPYIFETQDGQKIDASLGRLGIPESRKDPNGGVIKLAFIRLKSTSKNPGPPIFYLSGGPGVSGITHPQGRRSKVLLAIREIGDVILIDQRGTGMTEPRLDCGLRLDYPLNRPATREDLLRVYQERARTCAQGWKQKGVNLEAYNTIENADDINSLREALGLERISLLATSYGTTLATALLKRHRESVARVIMVGMEGPDQTYKLPSNGQKQISEIVRLCKENPEINLLVPDIPQLLSRIAEQLRSSPVRVEIEEPETRNKVSVVVGDFDLRLMTADSISQDRLIRSFPLALYAMSKGDFSALAEWAFRYRRREIQAMPAAMDCASGVSPERWNRILEEEPKTTLGRDLDFPFPDVCQAWGITQLDASFRSQLESVVPTLFISGTLDVRTPVSNAEEIQKGFPNSDLVILEGAAHSDRLLIASPQITDVILEFLQGLPLSTKRIVVPLEFEPVRGQ